MRFAIHYSTRYRYGAPVTDNLNALRVKPATTATQDLEDFAVRVEPEARLQPHTDYFGTTVLEFGISRPHESLSIDVRARVTTRPPTPPQETGFPELERKVYRAVAGEYLLPFGSEPDDIRIDELVGLVRGPTPLATLHKLVEVVPERFEYRTGVTYVGSTIEHLLETGAGVCQDFAHLSLLLLRRNGIAARYVSGYFFAPENGEEDADSAEVDTHAWLEALLPSERGGAPAWVGADPTNRHLVVDRHVKIGHGRHYSDVPPIKGVYRGPDDATYETAVRMHRTDAIAPAH